MKKLIILTLGLFTVVSCNNDDDTGSVEEKVEVINKKEKSDLEKEGLNGNVSSVRQIVYDATLVDDKIEKGYVRDGLDNYKRTYDSNGNKTEETIFVDKEEVQEKYTYAYNAFNQITETTKYAFNGALVSKISFGYNENQNLIKRYEVGSDGNQNNSTVFNYDNGKRTEELVYNYANQLDYKIVYTYENGRKAEESRYNRDNELEVRTVYTYDDKGNITEEKKYEGKELLDRFVYEYNQRGQKTLYERYSPNGSLGFKSTYEYDEKGNVVKEVFYTQANTVDFAINYKYTYDESGNWITKTEFEDDQPISITEREITYN